MMKTCSKCKIEKEDSEFFKRTGRKCGLTSSCKKCIAVSKIGYVRNPVKQKNYDLNRSYGITVNEYDSLLEKQNYSCGICGESAAEKTKGRKKYLCVDHDHETGLIRGLLCDSCNRALGLFGDSPAVLRDAIKYIVSHQARMLNVKI